MSRRWNGTTSPRRPSYTEMCAQLAAAQQREAKARRDMEGIHGIFQDLSVRVQQDEEEATRVQKEQDELL